MNGELAGKKGIFPAEFVDFIPTDLPQADMTASKEEAIVVMVK